MRRVICVGNRFVDADAAGPRVFDQLGGVTLPDGVEIVDGGLGGIDLVGFVDGCERVVFVDAIDGFAAPGSVVLLSAADAAGAQADGREEPFGHGAGLGYLLRALPLLCERAVPDVRVVGVEGPPDDALVRKAAALALRALVAPARTPGGGGGHAFDPE